MQGSCGCPWGGSKEQVQPLAAPQRSCKEIGEGELIDPGLRQQGGFTAASEAQMHQPQITKKDHLIEAVEGKQEEE